MTNNAVKKKPSTSRRVFTPQEKCQAILSIWSERRQPGEICREMGINWAMLKKWQELAMTGMMEALEPKRRAMGEKGPILGPRLEKLLEQAIRQRSGSTKLEKRLKTMQSEKSST